MLYLCFAKSLIVISQNTSKGVYHYQYFQKCLLESYFLANCIGITLTFQKYGNFKRGIPLQLDRKSLSSKHFQTLFQEILVVRYPLNTDITIDIHLNNILYTYIIIYIYIYTYIIITIYTSNPVTPTSASTTTTPTNASTTTTTPTNASTTPPNASLTDCYEHELTAIQHNHDDNSTSSSDDDDDADMGDCNLDEERYCGPTADSDDSDDDETRMMQQLRSELNSRMSTTERGFEKCILSRHR